MKRGTWLSAVLVLAPAAGCGSMQPHTVRIDSTVGMYQMAKLTYRIDAGKLSEPVNVANITGKQVSYEQKPSGPYADRSVARLAIEYPHPGGKPGFALAEVVVEARKPPVTTQGTKKSTWRRLADDMHQILTQNGLPGVKLADGIHEAWYLDLPRSDLDAVIGQLSQAGYFHLAGNPAPGVNVSCKIDGQQVNKQWGHVTALDELIERVRHEGQLASYTRPLDDEPLKPAGAQPVRFAASWPPVGAVPGASGPQGINSPSGDWVANQVGAPVSQPGASPQPGASQGMPANWPAGQGPYMTASANRGVPAAQVPYTANAPGPYQANAPSPNQSAAQGPYSPAPPGQYTRAPSGRYPQRVQQPYGPTSQPGGASGAATGQPAASQAFPSTAARYPLGGAAPQSSAPSYDATGPVPYGPGYRAPDGPAGARY
ncbi:MAG TPA: hypothetical protein VND64_06520 [Pirellulales bacterium]|nr:hypothetical protein [Pirellulales bacterium]